jgi:xylulose-5-phosphate/fructose-6-phosphate phosphoketolase
MTQLASAGGDTSADNVGSHGGETVAPRRYALSAAKGPGAADSA